MRRNLKTCKIISLTKNEVVYNGNEFVNNHKENEQLLTSNWITNVSKYQNFKISKEGLQLLTSLSRYEFKKDTMEIRGIFLKRF